LSRLFLVGIARIRDTRDSCTGVVGRGIRGAGARHAAKHDTGSGKPPTCADIAEDTGDVAAFAEARRTRGTGRR
jgi:hypothetical protein